MIPPRLLLPQDNVDLRDHGPREDERDFDAWHKQHGKGPLITRVHASAALHAMCVEPERYELVDREKEAAARRNPPVLRVVPTEPQPESETEPQVPINE